MSTHGIRLIYTTDKLGIIEELISGYSGDGAIIREILQNAEDAGREDGKFVEFHVYSDKMVVRNNATPFTEKNWHDITTIASREKKAEREKIGAFGIGFVSVYQITDYPEIRSNGQRLVLDPMKNELYTEPIADNGVTEFHFKYRGAGSKIGTEIGASPFGPDRIQGFLALSAEEIYRSSLFLDTISRVSVYQDDRLIVQVEKNIDKSQSDGMPDKKLTVSKLTVSWQRDGQETITHEWIILQKMEFDVSGIELPAPKRNTVSIALNLSNPNFPCITDGLLYNFLPAELIKTGFQFHINGDFFAESNRKSIIIDSSNKGKWNKKVISEIAKLFVESLPILKKLFPPKVFYQILPKSEYNVPTFLREIPRQFIDVVKQSKIVYASDGSWHHPKDDVFLVDASLRSILAETDVVFVHADIQDENMDFFKTLGVEEYDVFSLIKYLKSNISPKTELSEAPTFINSREKLYRVFNYLKSNLYPTVKERLMGAAIVLGEDGLLYDYGNPSAYLAHQREREILAESEIPLVDSDLEQKYRGILSQKTPEMKPSVLIEYLAQLTKGDEAIRIPNTDEKFAVINSFDKLCYIYHYLNTHRDTPPRGLKGARIIPDTNGYLQRTDKVYLGTEQYDVRKLLKESDIAFVASEVEKAFRHFLQSKAGVMEFTPHNVAQFLCDKAQEQVSISDQHPCFNSLEKLSIFFEYFKSIKYCPVILKRAAIIPDIYGILHSASKNNIYYFESPEVSRIFQKAKLLFIENQFQHNYRPILKAIGAKRLEVTDLIQFLADIAKNETKLEKAHPALRNPEELKYLYQFFVKLHSEILKKGLKKERIQKLKRLPIYLTQGEWLKAIEGGSSVLSLPAKDIIDAPTQVEDLIHRDVLTSNQVRHFFEDELGVEPLTLHRYVTEYIPRYYHAENVTDEVRFKLLEMIQRAYRTLPQDKVQGMIAILQSIRLVKCQDGEYRLAGEVYFPSADLDRIFLDNYSKPADEYKIPRTTDDNKELTENPWYKLFSDLGVKEAPSPDDLIEEIKRMISEEYQNVNVERLEFIFRYIQKRWEKEYSTQKHEFEPLKELAWLPATGNSSRYYPPNRLHLASLNDYVGNKCSLGFKFQDDISKAFASFLGIIHDVKDVPTEEIVNHLLNLSKGNGTATVQACEQIYRTLSSSERIKNSAISKLIGQRVIYAQRKFWLPKQVFLKDYREEFGNYRGYWTDATRDLTRFFVHIGVPNSPPGIDNYLTLLKDIAIVYSDTDEIVSDEDQELLLRTYETLSKRSDEIGKYQYQLAETANIKVVLSDANQLLTPDSIFFPDKANLKEKFDNTEGIFCKFNADTVRPFLRLLGVRDFSRCIKREMIEYDEKIDDVEESKKFRSWLRALHRIQKYHRKERRDGWNNLEQFGQVYVYRVSNLKVRYSYEISGDWEMGKECKESAFYDVENNSFYLDIDVDNIQLDCGIARELAFFLNPEIDRGKLTSNLAHVVKCRDEEEIDKWLNELDIDILRPDEEQHILENISDENIQDFGEETEEAVPKISDEVPEQTFTDVEGITYEPPIDEEDLGFTDEIDERLNDSEIVPEEPSDRPKIHKGEPSTSKRIPVEKQPKESRSQKEKGVQRVTGVPPTEEQDEAQEPQMLRPPQKSFLEMLQIQQEKGGSTIPDEPDSTHYDKAVDYDKIRDFKIKELTAKAQAADDDNRRRIEKTLNLLQRTQSQKFDHDFIQTWLYENYKGHCQICHPENFPSTFTVKDGKNHFVRHYLVKFEDTERYIDEGNALCLCPMHHSMLEYAQWDLTNTIREDLENPVEEEDEDGIPFLKIRIFINGEEHFIRYREEHFEMLKVLVDFF